MLQGCKDPSTLVAEIKMTRMVHEGAFLVVEGTDDLRFWRNWRNPDCELIDGGGKMNVVECVRRLDSEKFNGILGIVDSDYGHLMNEQLNSVNLLATDAHDLECLLCRSTALDKVLNEYGNPSKIHCFEKLEGTDVRTGLIKRALIFGRLRWAALRFQLCINSNEINVPRFVDSNTWTVDSEELIRVAVKDRSSSADVLKHRLRELPEADSWYIVRGHDVIEILKIGLWHVLGDRPTRVGAAQISSVLRAGISREELKDTLLWKKIRLWESKNQTYLVLN